MKVVPWMLLALACGDKDADDTGIFGQDGGAVDGGADDGGGADGGSADGGAGDGGASDGGASDGGASDGGASDGGASDGGSGDGGDPEEDLDEDGWTVGEGDCDDADPAVHPGAEEVCGDGVISDCSPASDANRACFAGGRWGLDEAWLIAGDPTASAFGKGLLGAADLTGDGRPDLLASAGDGSAGAWLFAGPLDGPTSTAAAAAVYQPGSGARSLGEYGAAAVPGDVDGDGYDDLWLGAPGSGAGAAWLFHGPLDGALEPAATLAGDRSGDALGWHLAGGSLGGAAAVAIGVPRASGGGQVLVYAGDHGGALEPGDADVVVRAGATDALLGTRVAAGTDLDGDGLGDLVVGAPGAAPAGGATGAAYAFFAPLAAELELGDADAVLAGEVALDEAGGGLCAPGDVDGDGHADLWVGADEHAVTSAGNGVVYLVPGPVSGSRALADATVRRTGEQVNDHLGWQISCDQDLDGDGLAELLLGVGADDVDELANAGSASLWLSPFDGTAGISDADLLLVGEAASQVLGNTAILTPDLDGDGWPDVAVGSDTGGGATGRVGVFPGITGGY